MPSGFHYKSLYDRLRSEGYHQQEDQTSHLIPYIDWLKAKTQYGSVLDIGCGAGGSLEILGSEGQTAFGIDVSSLAIEKGIRLGRNVVEASAVSLPYADNQFDLVVSADVMEHLHGRKGRGPEGGHPLFWWRRTIRTKW